VKAASENYASGDAVVNVQAATDGSGTAYWVVSGSTDVGDYAHSLTDPKQAKALASAIATMLDQRAQALATYQSLMTALDAGDAMDCLKAFGI
jgi:hypothetical protein